MAMKKLCFSFILLAQIFANSGDKLYGGNIDVYSRTLQTERSREFDAIHYRIKLRFDEDKKMFWGETRITLRPLSDGFEKCFFDAEKFIVSSVKDQSGQPLEFHQGNGKIVVSLGQTYDYGDELSVTVFYFAKDCGASRNFPWVSRLPKQQKRIPGSSRPCLFPTGRAIGFRVTTIRMIRQLLK